MHMAQPVPLPLTVSCFSKIQIGFTFLVPAHLGSPGKRAVKRVCVSVVYKTPTVQCLRSRLPKIYCLVTEAYVCKQLAEGCHTKAELIITITTTTFTVLSSCQSHCESSPQSNSQLFTRKSNAVIVTPPGHTHTHTFNGPFSWTTQVSQYQKGKTNQDFTEARDSTVSGSGISWAICKSAPCSR